MVVGNGFGSGVCVCVCWGVIPVELNVSSTYKDEDDNRDYHPAVSVAQVGSVLKIRWTGALMRKKNV